MGRLWLTGWKNTRWVLFRLLLEGAATGTGKMTLGPHPDARTHGISAPSRVQGVWWSHTGASSSTPRPRRGCGPHSQSQPRATVPSSRQEGGDQGGSAKTALLLAEAAPPRQSCTVLQTLRWGGFGPGPAKVPAALPSPADPHGAATLPGHPPFPAPRSIRSPLTPAPFTLKRLDPRPHRCPASYPNAAGTEEALPKP